MKSLSTSVVIVTLLGLCCVLSAESPLRKKGESRPSKKAGEILRKKGEQKTPIPWKELRGKRITVVGRGMNHKIGAHAHGKDFVISVDLPGKSWPRSVYNRTAQNQDAVPRKVKVTGKLEQWNDVPVFTPSQNKGQQGVPVPEGVDLEEARKRYVLVDVKWEIVPEMTGLTTRKDLVKLASPLRPQPKPKHEQD